MLKKVLSAFLLACALLIPAVHTEAALNTVYVNDETSYSVVIEDDADLLTDEEEGLLAEIMKPLTAYGYAMFKTIDYNSYSTTYSYAADYIYSNIGNASVTMFIIDMDVRHLDMLTNGRARKILTDAKCNSITDNIYTYASRGDYYSCASKAFSQADTLLNGGRIAEPMRYVTSGILALLIALFVNFIIVYFSSRVHRAADRDILAVAEKRFGMANQHAALLNTTKRYSPQSSSSGGSGSSGGGGGGGGGFSGGGGGHSF